MILLASRTESNAQARILVNGHRYASTTPDSAYFHFTNAAVVVSGRTNVSGDPTTGVRSATMNTITVSSVATANWATFLGVGSFNNGGSAALTFFTPALAENHWFCTNTYASGTHQMLVSNLDPTKLYTIRISGRVTSGTSARTADYRVQGNGAVSSLVNVATYNNTTAGAVFTGITPDGSGTIKIWVSKPGSSDLAVVNGLDVLQEN